MDDMDDDGPIAVRDFPPGCVKIPRSSGKHPTRQPKRSGARAEETVEESDESLPASFDQLSARDQFEQRRALYSRLLEHYQKLKLGGHLIGNRPDLQAMKEMNTRGTSFDFQGLGDVPGLLVGDTFAYRSEMFALGLHRQVQGGIAWVDRQGEKVACSVVVSGGYRDDDDRGETIKYSGQGGNNYKGDKRQLEDQKSTPGNEALIASCKRGGVVRVIRGHDVEESGWNKTYSYDGLYRVTHYDLKMGQDGHKVYTFDLARLPDQPPLDLRKWMHTENLKK